MANDVLFEIGLEELPARFINDAEQQLKEQTKSWLDELRISYFDVISYSTPRRLAVHIKEIAASQTAISEEVKGPQVKIAKDAEDNWTKAALGFTKGQGMTTDDIYIKEIKNIPYIFVKKNITGNDTKNLLPTYQSVIEGLSFPKTMRWGTETMRYVRPIRWLVALYGQQVIPFEIAGVTTGNITYGHRFLGSDITLDSPSEYSQKLKRNYVIASVDERRSLITAGIKSIEEQEHLRVIQDEDLLEEVCNLIEYPTVFFGHFDDTFLQLPKEVLTASMIEHQRYFPVEDMNERLASYFIGVRNGDDTAIDTVVQGNEKVLHARLQDARFFYEEDQKHTLAYYQEKLEYVVFQEKLGTIKDKTVRMSKLTESIARILNCDSITTEQAVRSAEICKFDLTTDMVNEFTELQGIIGETYAIHLGEEKSVARAIREHYLPIQANGNLPETEVGALVSISDKLDTIVGCISAGLIPTGSQDPYGLRRKALGILHTIVDQTWDIHFEQLLDITIDIYKKEQMDHLKLDGVMTDLNEFFKLRASYVLKELNVEADIIEAVLHQHIGNFRFTIEKAKILSDKRQEESFKTVHEALLRVLHLAAKASDSDMVDTSLFQTQSESDLYSALQNARTLFEEANEKRDAIACLNVIASLATPIHTFFDRNMVMDSDAKIRHNRLALVNELAIFIQQYADLSVIEWKQQY